MDTPSLLINTPTTLALAIIALWLGYQINRRVVWLERYNIPAAVSGGLLISSLIAQYSARRCHCSGSAMLR
ncbi:sodium/glutamate symporter [Halopseudomonas salegens]|uniref:Glutamate:Na+ symporter, ESS family n=1 Tax=Halopseudomonas salegens TaxID=1434072 RepID=A0A1H2HLY8_9GAMM|nr:sodium/glutamate symporter [Halopseudomonas salegens]SDU32845.1 glutamate:Na+ symporter, ESS family [Halopseudomonas salegens]